MKKLLIFIILLISCNDPEIYRAQIVKKDYYPSTSSITTLVNHKGEISQGVSYIPEKYLLTIYEGKALIHIECTAKTFNRFKEGESVIYTKNWYGRVIAQDTSSKIYTRVE